MRNGAQRKAAQPAKLVAMTTATPQSRTKQPGPGLWLSIAVFLLGATLATVGGFLAFTRAFESLTAESFPLPGTQERELEPGEYDVFASTGSITNFDGFSGVRPGDVTITNVATSETIVVREQSLDLTLNRQTTSYVAIGVFTVVDGGTYEITVDSDGSERAVVGRSFLTSWERVRVPVIMAVVGSVFLLVGTVMIVAGIVRRNRAKKAARPVGPGGPGGQAAPPPNAPPSAPPGTPPAPPAGVQPSPPKPPNPPSGQPGRNSPADSETPWG